MVITIQVHPRSCDITIQYIYVATDINHAY